MEDLAASQRLAGLRMGAGAAVGSSLRLCAADEGEDEEGKMKGEL